ncbi:hypothetical protein Esti_000051 [Eimeria stiedai]
MAQDALVGVQRDDIPQILASCCLKLTAQRATALDILDLLLFAAFTCLATQSQTIQEGLLLDRPICVQLLAFLHCNSLIDCRLLALSVFIVSYRRQPVVTRASIRNLLISLLGKDVVNLAEPILAALKPRLLDDIDDPRLSLRAYLVVTKIRDFSPISLASRDKTDLVGADLMTCRTACVVTVNESRDCEIKVSGCKKQLLVHAVHIRLQDARRIVSCVIVNTQLLEDTSLSKATSPTRMSIRLVGGTFPNVLALISCICVEPLLIFAANR